MTRRAMIRLQRRRFLEVAGAGVAAAALSAGLVPRPALRGARAGALGQPARHDRGARRLPLLGRAEVRLLRRHRDHPRARADGGDRDHQAGRPGPGRHRLPLAGRVLARPRAGHTAGLGLAHGRLRRVQLRLPQGREAGCGERARRQDDPAWAAPAGSRSSIRCSPRPASTRRASATPRPATSGARR